MRTQVKIAQGDSYKIGLDEVVGLKLVLTSLMKPLQAALNEQQSWGSHDWFQITEAEYKSRDGFIPYNSNCGGLMIESVVPDWGQYDFQCLAWPEFTPSSESLTEEEQDEERQSDSDGGQLDSYLRIFLKFEGFNEKTGAIQFYLNASTCDEAPYFRLKYSKDLFESSFEAKTLVELHTKGKKHIAKLIKRLGIS